MILYFSGTGNSRYAARSIGSQIQDQTLNLFQKIRAEDYSQIHSDRPWVLVTPTYAWRIPRIIEYWLRKTRLTGSKEIYFIMTCAGGIGNAAAHVKKLCAVKEMHCLGCIPVIMPENYIALFQSPAAAEALAMIEQAEVSIRQISVLIRNRERYLQPAVNLRDKLESGAVHKLFYPLFVHAKKFTTTKACIACGKCETLCPLGNIRLQEGKPVWGGRCTHCMACICLCPAAAIEYGKHTRGLLRYRCPKSI